MANDIELWKQQLEKVLADFSEQATLSNDHLFVIGCSTSEVIGEKIGTSGTMEVAAMIFNEVKVLQEKTGVLLAFQCCEHLNRALIVERETARAKKYDIVTVTPVRSAGGAMATHAYHNFTDPVVVEFIKADAGIDIGDTFIGMHLKHVAVPLRSTVKQVGHAHVTLAKTRPKLIGGARAVYDEKEENYTC
ncbi:TIGR01440 family protein [Cytobacillus sp. S13-E01]|uniref:TIGR01440 family protein n=1 Tax=Cytobacillus sp. S13-E01 TaxID=3031326 RepID=UPI0023D7C123|nr:TIGR01440 family protein [Cytobacillus sp. S13-E01]MDF0726618.1 TIGR01440 family protein [Cytobacillus sp. S13-E01]